MSIFGNAQKVEIKDEALDTKNWISDRELAQIFFVNGRNSSRALSIKN